MKSEKLLSLWKGFFFLFIWTMCLGVFSQNSNEQWKDIDARPVPSWFSDAKFGIFIHWGPYSVPAWSPSGTYTEWYQHWWYSNSISGNNNPQADAIPNFQKKVYGEESSYYDFAKMFKAELYNPTQWAELFKKSGAKYVILTSKHHDGFTLWPNEHAQNARFFPWNAGETGPKRDLLKPYVEAMHGSGLKAGLYYSLYEWYHPWYQSRSEKFITDHYHPQFKEMVNNYEPDLIYGDGEWNEPDSYWRSGELLTWLFNESPVGDKVVINDRWFNDSRHKHGGYYTTEYDTDGIESDHPWEEIRGMGLSFGYNRAENIEDYNSPQALVLMLCDVVSLGGNLCLNVGPSADGRIPVIMQERLLQIGSWLDVNGEAIYGSSKWDRPYQWSEGSREFNFKEGKSYIEGDYILKQTVDPLPGKAVKEAFFTRKGMSVYAIFPQWPGKTTRIKNVNPENDAKVSLLGFEGNLSWKKEGSDIIVELPIYDPHWNLPEYAYTLKISSVK